MPTLVTVGVVLQVIAALVALCLNLSTPFPVRRSSSPRQVPTVKGLPFVTASRRYQLSTVDSDNRPHEIARTQSPHSHLDSCYNQSAQTPFVSSTIVSRLERARDSIRGMSNIRSHLNSVLAGPTSRQIIHGPGFGWDWATAASVLDRANPPSSLPPIPYVSAQKSCCDSQVIEGCHTNSINATSFPSEARIRVTIAVLGGEHPGPLTLGLSRKLKSLGVSAVFYFPIRLLLASDLKSSARVLRDLADDGHAFGLRIESAPISLAAIHSAAQLYAKLRPDAFSHLHLYIPPYALYPDGLSGPVREALKSLNVHLVFPNWMLNEHEMVGRTVGTREVIRASVLAWIASEESCEQGNEWIIGVSGGNAAEVGLVAAAVDAMKLSNAVALARDPVHNCFHLPVGDESPASTANARNDCGGPSHFAPPAKLPCAESRCWQVDLALNPMLDSFVEDYE